MKRGATDCSPSTAVHVDTKRRRERRLMHAPRASSRDLIERLQPIDQAGARPGYLKDMRPQSGARNVACQSRQVGCQAQTVQVIS
jgi:hypothetical protein